MQIITEAVDAPVLPDITDVEPLSEADLPCIQEIAEVLKKHNAISRFGINLLHEHFAVAEDEILVEGTDVDKRVSITKPVKRAELAGVQMVGTSWRLDTGDVLMHCSCTKDYAGNHLHVHNK